MCTLPSFPLVPKLYLGMYLFSKLSFDLLLGSGAKFNFADKCVPKYNLGTRGNEGKTLP